MSQAGRYINNSGPAGFVQTLTGNVGGPVPPSLGNINIVGSGDITVTGNPGTNTLTISDSGAVPNSFPTDAGTATPAAGVLNIFGAHGINTSGAGNTVTVAVDNTLTLGDLAPIGTGADSLTLTTGDLSVVSGNINLPLTSAAGADGVINVNGVRFIHDFGATNTFVGSQAGNFTLTGFSSTGIGTQALQSQTSAAFNTAVGFAAGGALTSGSSNVAIGSGSLGAVTTTGSNTAIGASSLAAIVTGTNNIALGYFSGSALTTNDSNNIIIGTVGVAGDNARLRIGTVGTQTSAFIAGIDGVNVGSVARVVTENANQLGTATITAGTGITVTPSANTITIAATGTTNLTYTNVNTTPYVVLTTDEYLSVDSSGGAITVQLPNAATLGRVFIIKDRTGSAAASNITVTTVGGAVNIDGATTFVMNTNRESINVIGNATSYEVF